MATGNQKYPDPLAEFVPTRIQGLPVMIPTTGQTGFELTEKMGTCVPVPIAAVISRAR